MFDKFRRCKRGNFAVMLAIASIPVMSAVAGAVDYVSMNMKVARLQDSLDAAALEIGVKYYSGMSQTQLEEIGKTSFIANMLIAEGQDPGFTYDDGLFDDFGAELEIVGDDDFVTVSSSISHDGFIGWAQDWSATRESVVLIRPGDPACVLALNKSASSAIKIQGSTLVDMEACILTSNSRSPTAVTRDGSSIISAECVTTVGGTSGIRDHPSVTMTCPYPLENQYPTHDPLATIKPPNYGPCQTMPGGKTKTLSPGTYCNKTFSGDITLQPGVYLLAGGGISLGGNGAMRGSGVTIFLMEGASFQMNANQSVDLSPPTEGPYAGITVYQPINNTQQITINGTLNSEMSGYIYAPGAHVFYAGDSDTASANKCIRIIGDTVELNGNSQFSSDCTGELGGRAFRVSKHISIHR